MRKILKDELIEINHLTFGNNLFDSKHDPKTGDHTVQSIQSINDKIVKRLKKC